MNQRVIREFKAARCHGTTCLISWINLLHPLTITRVLITNTCNHLPLPFISSLTSVTHRLVSRLQGSLCWSMPTYLPVHPGTRLCLWKRKFTYSWYCSSCFQCILRYLSYVGRPTLVIFNKLPFDLHLPVCLLDQYVTPVGQSDMHL